MQFQILLMRIFRSGEMLKTLCLLSFTEGVTDVIIYSSPDDSKKKNRGFAFLEYESHKAASLAKRRLSSGRIRVWGCDIIVDWADPIEEPDSDTMAKVFERIVLHVFVNFHN